MNYIYLQTLYETQPGAKWQNFFNTHWPNYKKWYLSKGEKQRPGFLTCQKQLKKYMPELFPIWEKLVELAGGGDLQARFLSLYNPPPFVAGCSQMVWLQEPLALVRNYDYSPHLFDATLLHTQWCQPVIAVSDCLWGALDGINAAGLCVSLAFGGSQKTGEGFAITLILRYLLECCYNVNVACQALQKIPSHMAYNVLLLDSNGNHMLAQLAPEQEPQFSKALFSTNHQCNSQWLKYLQISQTYERYQYLEHLFSTPTLNLDSIIRALLNPPLYSTRFDRGFGTLYTAAYYPTYLSATFHWPGLKLERNFSSTDEPAFHIQYT
ncbi:MAG: C45 family peptidase [Bacteroidia bacterium]|nr:C45 family autoproteolytic acyltransferase/hydrolase [Bacteroidia bacterium]MDW8159677.1 C45 family peptidase [Bacteroidia bacterium]